MKKLISIVAVLVASSMFAAVGGNDLPTRDPFVAPVMVDIPAPSAPFVMGSPTDEQFRGVSPSETEITVTLTYGWRVGETEITTKQVRDLMHKGDGTFGRCDECPANGVSWYDAVDFADTLSAKQGLDQCYGGCAAACGPNNTDISACFDPCFAPLASSILSCTGYRLPTATEFEYMSRTGHPRADGGVHTGSGIRQADGGQADGGSGENNCIDDPTIDPWTHQCSNTNDDDNPRPIAGDCTPKTGRSECTTTQPVKAKLADANGVYGIHGNVYEWVHDWTCSPRSETVDPIGTGAGCSTTGREKRGGSHLEPVKHMRHAQRSSDLPDRRIHNIGFRVVLNGVTP